MTIFCIQCDKNVDARLTNGREIYPRRPDLYRLPFWICDVCKNYVGCHHKTRMRTAPLGCIATPKIFRLRHKIHAVIDPIWKKKKMRRKSIYIELTKVLGRQYHTADLRSEAECQKILSAASLLYKRAFGSEFTQTYEAYF